MEDHLKAAELLESADLIVAKNSTGDTLRVFKDKENFLGHLELSYAQIDLIDEKGFVSEILCVKWQTNGIGEPYFTLRIAEKEDLF